MKLKPARPGLLVKDPVTRVPLSEAGEEKPKIAYWFRRLRDGTVVEVKEQARPAAAARSSKRAEE
jgi:hypothetical protein